MTETGRRPCPRRPGTDPGTVIEAISRNGAAGTSKSGAPAPADATLRAAEAAKIIRQPQQA